MFLTGTQSLSSDISVCYQLTKYKTEIRSPTNDTMTLLERIVAGCSAGDGTS